MLRNSKCAELNMASVWMLLLFNSLFMSGLSMDVQLIKVYPKQAVFGVFEASLGNEYALNASSARDVCEHLGVTIASKTQVVEAQKHGLETCRFGWIDEQIVVVPRVQVKSNCGNGRVGVVVWRADLNKKFDVFCFNLTDFEIQSQAAMTTETSTEKPITFTPKASTSSPLSSSIPPALNNIEDTEKHLAISGTPAKTGVVPVALLITATFAVLLAVFLALYHFKRNRSFRMFCDAEQQQEVIETDVWENCSKKDLQKPQEENVQEKEKEENNNNNNSNSSSSSDQE